MVFEVLMQHTLPTEWNNLKKLFLKNRSRRMSGLCNQNGTLYPVGCIFCSTSNNSKSSPTGPRRRDPNSPSTQSLTFWAGDFRQMGKFLIAIVALAAAEKHLRVFFCGYALLPASGRDRYGEEGKRKKRSQPIPASCLWEQTCPKLPSPRTFSCCCAAQIGSLHLQKTTWHSNTPVDSKDPWKDRKGNKCFHMYWRH